MSGYGEYRFVLTVAPCGVSESSVSICLRYEYGKITYNPHCYRQRYFYGSPKVHPYEGSK